jgi:hypothetical protein
MNDVKPDMIFQVAYGFMASKLLFVAHEVGIFEQLADSPATLDELAQRFGRPRRTMRILTDAMVALGFVENHGGRYHNSAAALRFLSGRGNEDLRPCLRYLDRLNYSMWMKLEEAVRTGQSRLQGSQTHRRRATDLFGRGRIIHSRGCKRAPFCT